jgi:hypothetical protein
VVDLEKIALIANIPGVSWVRENVTLEQRENKCHPRAWPDGCKPKGWTSPEIEKLATLAMVYPL